MNSGVQDAQDPRVTPVDARLELARYTTQLALDRTTLAWIRTTLTMASFGLGMIAFFRSRQASPEAVQLHEAAVRFGTGLMLLGIGATVLAGLSHWAALRRLRRGEVPVVTQWPLALTVAVLLAVIGLDALRSLLGIVRP
jgi:uncharacterized membrane protein YidH (DUF202 family)